MLRPFQGAALLLTSFLLLAPALRAAPLELERLDLEVHIDPRFQALYAKAQLVLRNDARESRDTVELEFSAPLAPRIQVRSVWDRRGELPWRLDSVSGANAPRLLLVGLRSALAPGKKQVVVVSYEVDLQGFTASAAPVAVSSESARLSTTGWYPVPAGSDPALPRALHLTVRLPKEWQVAAPVKLKQLRDGTALASYELELPRVQPGQLLLRAGTALPP